MHDYCCMLLCWQVLLQGTGEMVWHPNYSMRSAVLINLSRSGNKWEGFSWLVDLNTPDEVRQPLEVVSLYIAACCYAKLEPQAAADRTHGVCSVHQQFLRPSPLPDRCWTPCALP